MLLLRFKDLQERGIVKHWQTLQRWIKAGDFPPGRLLGKQTRVWTESEIIDWFDTRPVVKGGE